MKSKLYFAALLSLASLSHVMHAGDSSENSQEQPSQIQQLKKVDSETSSTQKNKKESNNKKGNKYSFMAGSIITAILGFPPVVIAYIGNEVYPKARELAKKYKGKACEFYEKHKQRLANAAETDMTEEEERVEKLLDLNND